jgi:hypothetical protein
MPRKQKETYAASWSEELKQYEQKRNNAPELPQIKRFLRKDTAAREHEDRAFSIVTNDIADPVKKEELHRAEVDQAARHVNRAIQKHLEGTCHGYNIVTNSPIYGISEQSCNAMGGNQEPRGKKMDSTHRMQGSNVLTLGTEPGPEQPRRKPRHTRETDILSHRYLKDHDTRLANDMKKARDKVEAVSANTCEFNPLTGKFYNASQEALRVAEDDYRERKKREEVANHTYKTSGIVARSEGHAFDIISNDISNKEKVLTLERNTMKGIPQRSALRMKWDYQRDVEEALRDADISRALNRMSNERTEEVRRRGYDVLSNAPLAQTLPVTSSKPSKDKPVLDRLHEAMETRAFNTSSVLHDNGPRTTTERLFQSPGSAITTYVNTFKGRQELLVPSLTRALGQPLTGFAS